MIKDLPERYTKTHHIAPDITVLPQIVFYYSFLGLVLVITFLCSWQILTKYWDGPVNFNLFSWPEIVFMVLFFAIYFSGLLIHYLLSLAVFRFFGKWAIYSSRRKAPSGRYNIKSLIPTWLSSAWVQRQAFPRHQYLFIIIFPFAGTLLILYGLLYMFVGYINPGLGFQFFIAIILVVFTYSGRMLLFLRLLLFPRSTYFVDRQSGLYVYDHLE
jgi:hypothetical protein